MDIKDPRHRNVFFYKEGIHRYLREYAGAMMSGLNKVPEEELIKAFNLLQQTALNGGRIFVGGNGGSAAISDHLVCDFVKGGYVKGCKPLKVHSLVGSTALCTAVANDFGYEHTFDFQLEAQEATQKDCVILISSSGNSKNISLAINYCFPKAISVIGLSGFSGGDLATRATARLHVPINNYGVVEDCHQALMHVLAQFYFLSLAGE